MTKADEQAQKDNLLAVLTYDPVKGFSHDPEKIIAPLLEYHDKRIAVAETIGA